MKRILLWGMLLLAAAAFGQERTPPAPPSLPALQRELSGLLIGARDNPAVTITHDQAQKLVPLLDRWKTAGFTLSDVDAQDVWNHVQAVLTAQQRAFQWKPDRSGGRGPGGGGFGQKRAGSPQDRQAQQFDRLVRRLSSL